jgi:hypothetical protein
MDTVNLVDNAAKCFIHTIIHSITLHLSLGIPSYELDEGMTMTSRLKPGPQRV